jgi:hypothetical protein
VTAPAFPSPASVRMQFEVGGRAECLDLLERLGPGVAYAIVGHESTVAERRARLDVLLDALCAAYVVGAGAALRLATQAAEASAAAKVQP